MTLIERLEATAAVVTKTPGLLHRCKFCLRAVVQIIETNEVGPIWVHVHSGDEWCKVTKAEPSGVPL